MSSQHDIPSTINGEAQHHRSTTTSSSSDFPDILGNDELAANLIKCATYVKLGETHHVLLRQTINDLTYFVKGKHVGVTTTTTNGSTTATGGSNPPGPPLQHHIPASRVLSKPPPATISNLASGMIQKLGLSNKNNDDASSVGAGSVSVRSETQKSVASMKHAEQAQADVQRTLGMSSGSSSTGNTTGEAKLIGKKPPFQRPTKASSSLIANGWIEQQRRSKLRVVWKEVLASLVEGRKPGEDTTLWIQREYFSHATNKTELEALHQIPIKLIRHISYQEHTVDHRFLIKVHNMNEDFIFRSEKSQEAAQNWVITIRSAIDILKDPNRAPTSDNRIPIRAALEQQQQQQQQREQRHSSNESYSASMNDEQKIPEQVMAPEPRQQPKQPQQHHATATAPPPVTSSARGTTTYPNQPPNTATMSRMSVSEMRAIAHGAGFQTHGMERGELEHIVLQIANSINQAGGGVSPPPPPPQSMPTPPIPNRPVSDPHLQRSTSAEEEMARQRQQQETIDRQQQIDEAAQRRKLAEDSARHRAAAEAQQVFVRQQQEAIEKKQRAEEERKRLEAERLRRDEEEHQRRVAEQRRRIEEQQRQQQEQWKQQQGNWQKQQVEEEQRRRADELRMAEEKRRQEEAYRAQHQQWQHQQQANGVPPHQWQQPHPPPYGQHPQPQPQPQPPPPHHQYPPGPQPPPASHHPNSQVDQKYAKMATQVADAGQQRSLQIIKHGILVEWALQPPAMQILRPIEVLITSVHLVFPPKYGVPGHEHFKKWPIMTLPEVLSGAQPDGEKLSKAVKKLRFVLHPDKLPRDLTEEQTYMCRMIWDIVSDAFEDHKKREEELSWMK